jgi:hypothetical protein
MCINIAQVAKLPLPYCSVFVEMIGGGGLYKATSWRESRFVMARSPSQCILCEVMLETRFIFSGEYRRLAPPLGQSFPPSHPETSVV